MSKRQTLIFGLLAAAVAGGGYYYFNVFEPARAAAQAKLAAAGGTAPAPVTVATVAKESVPVRIGTIGNAQAYSTVSVKSRVDGQIFAVGFQEGHLVHKGDLLFQIDPRLFEAQLGQAQANLARDKSQLVRANLDLQRYTELSRKDFASHQTYETARAAAESGEATVAADQAAVDQAKLNLEYTQIRSPIDGLTGNLLINAGNIVKAEDTPALVVINQVKPIYVSFSIPEQDLPEVKRRMAAGSLPVQTTIPGDQGPPEQGEVTFINNTVDTSTGTIQLKATFPNEDGRLTPGQFVEVAMTLTTLSDALVVPSRAIQTGQNGNYVFVVKPDRTVEQRPVELGVTVDTRSVVQKGLAPGEQVVTEGQIRLYPGAKVDIKNAA